MKRPPVHCVIPDVQAKPGVDSSHLRWIGNYIAEKRPDKIICIGDFADMPSLNSYAVGKATEGQRYIDDIKAAKEAMRTLMKPIVKPTSNYSPELHMCLGNHEHRIKREAETNAKFLGTISTNDLGYREAGWIVHDFLKVARIDGIEYSHYFISGVMGRPVSSASSLLRQRHRSATMGHVQKVDIAVHPNTQQIGLFCGICYTHEEDYLTPQGNGTKSGIWMKHEIREGTYDPMFVSLDFLKRRYS